MFLKFIMNRERQILFHQPRNARAHMEESSAFLTATLRMPRLAVAETDALAETPSDEL
jgi:hypothetical protein